MNQLPFKEHLIIADLQGKLSIRPNSNDLLDYYAEIKKENYSEYVMLADEIQNALDNARDTSNDMDSIADKTAEAHYHLKCIDERRLMVKKIQEFVEYNLDQLEDIE